MAIKKENSKSAIDRVQAVLDQVKVRHDQVVELTVSTGAQFVKDTDARMVETAGYTYPWFGEREKVANSRFVGAVRIKCEPELAAKLGTGTIWDYFWGDVPECCVINAVKKLRDACKERNNHEEARIADTLVADLMNQTFYVK